MAGNSDHQVAAGHRSKSPSFDTSVAHVARVYDYWLGGKDNFAADRAAGDQAIKAFPDIALSARSNRAFLARAVRFLAAEAGIRQFLDIGTGIPSVNNTHEVAQSVAPESRVVYVDNDPIVLAHARRCWPAIQRAPPTISTRTCATRGRSWTARRICWISAARSLCC